MHQRPGGRRAVVELGRLGLALTASLLLGTAVAQPNDGERVAPATPAQQLNLDSRQPWRAQIRAPLYGTGSGGARVTVGVADTGVDFQHPELSGRVVVGRNVAAGTFDIGDRNGHGTHVSALIAGRLSADSPLAGLAPNATLAVARVFADANTTTSTTMDRGIRWLVDVARTPIISLSLGSASPGDSAALEHAVRRGTLVVAAAGNGAGGSPGWPAAFASQPWAGGRIIAVGSVDADNRLSVFSNQAGDARNFYVVAPGERIASAYTGGRYATMSGTSMATPMVAAQAALIKSTWRYLNADQVAQVILRTTTDLGAPGVDAVYGWGLIDIERSMNPVGSLGIALNDKGRITIGPQTMTQSAAPATMGTTGGAAAVQSLAFDETGRHFTVKPGAALSRSTPLSLDSVFGPSDRMLAAASATLGPGMRMTTVTDSPRMPLIPVTIDPTALPFTTVRAMTLTYGEDSPRGWRTAAAGTGGMGSHSFGLAATSFGDDIVGAEQVFASPLLRFAGNHDHVALGLPIAPGWTARAGGATSRTPFATAQGNVGLLELVQQGERHVFSVGYGNLTQPSLLGATQPLLGFAQNSRTQALTFAGARRIADGFALAASFNVARTDALQPTPPGSLFEGATASRASGFGVAAVWSGLRDARDRLILSLSSPLRADSGDLHYAVISAVDPDTGFATTSTQTVQARPNGREKLAELRYALPLSQRSMVQFTMAARLQPDHDADAPTQKLLAVRYLASF